MPPESLLAAEDLRSYFPVNDGLVRAGGGWVRAVDGVDLQVEAGETLGLVGESGCGKSTLGRTLLRLVEPTGGSVRFDGVDVRSARGRALKALRRDMQIIFQDPVGSLNPRHRVGELVRAGLDIHGVGARRERRGMVRDALEKVGLPADAEQRFAHEFSGGQRQRIGIARALVLRPRFIVADEPVSALDVSVRSQIINLLVALKREMSLTYLFIAHDLAAVAYISDRIAVMYLGKIVEIGAAADVVERPLHPYTKALVSAIPELDPDRRRARIVLPGDVPSPIDPPSGCRFRTRCPLAQDICARVAPALERKGDGAHAAACHFAGQPIPAQAGVARAAVSRDDASPSPSP
jgi:oligopeptide/dipeptide ABC transporter ATP-binding protein